MFAGIMRAHALTKLFPIHTCIRVRNNLSVFTSIYYIVNIKHEKDQSFLQENSLIDKFVPAVLKMVGSVLYYFYVRMSKYVFSAD